MTHTDEIWSITYYVPAIDYYANDCDNDVYATFAPGRHAVEIPLLSGNVVAVTEEGPITRDNGVTTLWHDGEYGIPIACAIDSPYFARLMRGSVIAWERS